MQFHRIREWRYRCGGERGLRDRRAERGELAFGQLYGDAIDRNAVGAELHVYELRAWNADDLRIADEAGWAGQQSDDEAGEHAAGEAAGQVDQSLRSGGGRGATICGMGRGGDSPARFFVGEEARWPEVSFRRGSVLAANQLSRRIESISLRSAAVSTARSRRSGRLRRVL